MAVKFDSFVKALEALCNEHQVALSTEICVRDLGKGCVPILPDTFYDWTSNLPQTSDEKVVY